MKLVKIFNSIRDIPYEIPTSLTNNFIDCDEKHRKLSKLLEKEGIKTRFRVCVFLWSDLDILKQIIKTPHKNKCKHLYIEAFLDNKWITLDATWDIKLKNVLNVNTWDGKSNTELAVKPIKTYRPQKNHELSHNKTKESFLLDIKQSGEFYKKFNQWLKNERIKIY